MESRSIPRPRSRRLQALARRSSRRASPRSTLEVVGVSLSLVRRVARLPFIPWKVFKTTNVCLPVHPKTSNKQQNHQGSLSLTQRKECLQPRKRIQRTKAKDRPSAASLQASSPAPPAAAAACSLPASSKRPGGDGRGPPGESKRPSSKGGSGAHHQPGARADSYTEGSVVALSPSSSFCCGASVASEAHTGRTCCSSNGGRRRGRARRERETSRGTRTASPSTTGGGPSLGPSEGAPEHYYPAVHACRPRIFFITLSSIKRQAILDLSLAALRRTGPSSPCCDDYSTRTSSAKLETATASLATTAATEKALCPHVQTPWPPPMLLPAATAAAGAADERRTQETETAGTGEDN